MHFKCATAKLHIVVASVCLSRSTGIYCVFPGALIKQTLILDSEKHKTVFLKFLIFFAIFSLSAFLERLIDIIPTLLFGQVNVLKMMVFKKAPARPVEDLNFSLTFSHLKKMSSEFPYRNNSSKSQGRSYFQILFWNGTFQFCWIAMKK